MKVDVRIGDTVLNGLEVWDPGGLDYYYIDDDLDLDERCTEAYYRQDGDWFPCQIQKYNECGHIGYTLGFDK